MVPLMAGLALAAWPESVRADVPAGRLIYTVGTTFSANGEDHAYLLWMPTEEDLLRLRSYSIWSKPGPPESPALYEPVSWVRVITDPTVIELALRRAERLGQDLSKLEQVIDGLFDAFGPTPGVPRAEKLSALIQGAQGDPKLYHDLLVLARLYPAVSMCIGSAWAGPIDGLRTFELRMAGPDDGPDVVDAVRRVVGRVTLNPTAYQPLPAPGAPVAVPFGRMVNGAFEHDARGHLNTRLRWATPPALRSQSLLQFGYHVYRVDPAFYQSAGMGGGTMQAGDLANYAQAFPDMVKRVSPTPVLIERMLDDAEASDFPGDLETFHFIDDNGRFLPDGEPFEDGDTFQYMITAVDVLGRDGLASPATLVVICRTMGPNQPRNVAVRDLVTHPTPNTTRQVFGVTWQAPVPVEGDPPPDRYDIFRWEAADGPFSEEAVVNKVGSVTPDPGQEWMEFEDDSLGVPPAPEELNKTWWFTVRAVFLTACGEAPSPHSAPASGVLRDRRGPEPANGGGVEVLNSVAALQIFPAAGSEDLAHWDSGYFNVGVLVQRTGPGIAAANVFYRIDDDSPTGEPESTPLGPAPVDSVYLGTLAFAPGMEAMSFNTRLRLPTHDGNHSVTFHLNALDVHGNHSNFDRLTITTGPTQSNKRRTLWAISAQEYATELAAPADGPVLRRHVSRRIKGTVADPEAEVATPNLVPPDLSDESVAGWKIFRRIDFGPLVLIEEGEDDPPASINADLLSVNAGEVSYFLQTFTGAGFAGPLVELGRFEMTALEPPPQPMLLPVEALEGGKARLSWACPPHGVSRFHVMVAAAGGMPPDRISGEMTPAFENRMGVEVEVDGVTETMDFRVYDTGPLLGNQSPEHSVELDLESGVTYYFMVLAVAPSGERGAPGNRVEFAWIEPIDGGPDAVWPARPWVPINEEFKVPVGGHYGIQIARLYSDTTVTRVGDTTRLTPPMDLMARLEVEVANRVARRSLLPAVVYRYQVPNQRFPTVSGDVVQVTPLIEGIAARDETIGGTEYTVVYDPYFEFQNRFVYLRPSQPLVHQADYRYLLVLFRDDGEVDVVVPSELFTAEPPSPN